MIQLAYVDPQAAVFVLIGILLICLFISGIFYFKAKHTEKLLLIEKGLTDSPIKKSNGNNLQKVGIIIIAISIAIAVLSILNSIFTDLTDGIEVAVVGISGGLGMIYANRLDKKS